jgi:hypothetical protein
LSAHPQQSASRWIVVRAGDKRRARLSYPDADETLLTPNFNIVFAHDEAYLHNGKIAPQEECAMDYVKIRIRYIALGLVLALASSGLPQTAHAQRGGPDNHRSRLLLIFAPDENNKQLLDQYAQNQRAAGEYDGADIDVVYVIGDHMVKLPAPDLKTVSAEDLRKHYHVDTNGFRVVLVGDDGWEKRRWTEPTDPTAIANRAPDMPKPKSATDDKK